MRIFVPSAAAVLTDHEGHGEGLIAWRLLTGLAARGHELVVCARHARLVAEPPFELVITGNASRRESIEPIAYARSARKLLTRLGGAKRFSLAHWIFPAERDDVLFRPEGGLPYVVGPRFEPWPAGRARRTRAGDIVRAAAAPLFAALHDRALDAAGAILVATPAASATLSLRHRGKARVLSPGVDPARFPVYPLPDADRILFVGQLERVKGVRDLVAAFTLVRGERPRAQLVLAGDGPERHWLEERRESLGNGAIVLEGSVPNDQVPRLLRDASLLCLPSHGEPYGMAAVEAMAAGRAVVATDAGGLRFLVDGREGGRRVPPGDVSALAAALGELLADRERLGRMGAHNRVRVERELSLERMLDRLEEVYAEVCG